MVNFMERLQQGNRSHAIDEQELRLLLDQAHTTFLQHFTPEIYFERSIFINWTCAIADCKYCFLSTKPRYNPQKIAAKKPWRSPQSVLAEALVCKAMGWDIGYITGGLRVEPAEYLVDLVLKLEVIQGAKMMMNFGPYSRSYLEQFKPYILGMGSAIESFDEELHNFICPSKPLKSLLQFLKDLQELGMQKLITIILGMGEQKEDVEVVIQKIKEYNIEKIQLCFLKPQEKTIFQEVPSPDIHYMAWWTAKIRIACPTVHIKVAVVKERMSDFSLLLRAGANSFSRFMVFEEFASPLARQLEEECRKGGRTLRGYFTSVPEIDVQKLVEELPFEESLKARILPKAVQYYRKLKKKVV